VNSSDVKTGLSSQQTAVLSKPVFTGYQNIIIIKNIIINLAQAPRQWWCSVGGLGI